MPNQQKDAPVHERKIFEVEFTFVQPCVTRGWTIQASSTAEAEKLAAQCIDEFGCFDDAKFTELGGETASWDTLDGPGSEFEVGEILNPGGDEDEG